MRFEEPNAMTRWDSPLFVIDCNPTNTEGDEDMWEPAPLDAIWEATTQGKATKAPDVVAPSRATTSNYLSMLESTTQLILSSFQALTSFGNMPDTGGLIQLSLALPNSSSAVQMPLNLPLGQKTPTTAALQRLRRQFVKMHASGAMAGNELGHALSQEGRVSSFAPQEDGRAERKAKQNVRKIKENKPTTIEEDIAKRFITYLEVTL
jgi:protein KTI12